MTNPFPYTCPYCHNVQTVTEEKVERIIDGYKIKDEHGRKICGVQVMIGCSNEACKRFSLNFSIYEYGVRNSHWTPFYHNNAIYSRFLLPESSAKPQPSYIPRPLAEDYYEACAIKSTSPKASATLARRCLQGMIRDFCGISAKTLYQEISELKKAVDESRAPQGVTIESVDAIDGIRSVGNIGAHMEQNIDHIVPVDPAEAQILIELIESLFVDWYVARQKRQERFASVKALAESKKAVIESFKEPLAIAPPEPPKA